MKIISKMLLVLFVLLSFEGVAQNNSDHYYYYQDKKVFLDLDLNAISISFQGEEQVNFFKTFETNLSTSKVVQDNTRASVKTISQYTKNRQSLKTYFLIKATKNPRSEKEYFQQLEVSKTLPDVLSVAPAYHSQQGKTIGLSNNFYVKLKHPDDIDILLKKAKEMNLEVLGYNQYMPLWFTLSVPNPRTSTALDYANLFHESHLFESAEPAFMYYDLIDSNDPFFDDQWSFNNTGQLGGIAGIDINAEEAWAISTGANVKVAVIDQGIELDHPDLQANIYGTGFDAQFNTTPSQVWGPHGTACAGIIGAVKDNGEGISGVAPSSELMSVSVSFWATTMQMLANGMNWSWQNGADVISNSWGSTLPSPFFDGAVQNAFNNGRNGLGCIIVFSSGNDNINGAQYPSNSDTLILCVGAIDKCGVRSGRIDIIPASCDPWCEQCREGSSYGTPLDVVAGGTSIATTDRQGDYQANGDYNPWAFSPPNNYSNFDYTRWFGGTSAACPHVAGVAALILSINPNLTVQEVNDIIEISAQKIRTDLYTYNFDLNRSNGTWNNELGYGLVDAYQAVLITQDMICEEDLYTIETIPSGTVRFEEVSNMITSYSTIETGADVTYSAGTQIILGVQGPNTLASNFHAKAGATFRAYIEGCTAEPEPRLPIGRIMNAPDFYKQAQSEEFLMDEIQTSSPNEALQTILHVYPNPAKNVLNLSYTGATTINNLSVSDHLGKVWIVQANIDRFLMPSLDIANLPTGIYFLNVSFENGQESIERFVKL